MNADDLFLHDDTGFPIDARDLYALLRPSEFFLCWLDQQLSDRKPGIDFLQVGEHEYRLRRTVALDIAIPAVGPVGRYVRQQLIMAEEELASRGLLPPSGFGEELIAFLNRSDKNA